MFLSLVRIFIEYILLVTKKTMHNCTASIVGVLYQDQSTEELVLMGFDFFDGNLF